MQPIYEHRQFGTAMLFLLLVPTLFFGIAVSMVASASTIPGLLIVLLFMFLTAFIFSSLTVRVDAKKVQLAFGPGVLRRTIPLDSIEQVRVVRNAPWMGLGIHFIRHGMIYNVSGLEGIEITLKGGRVVRIGSDEPVALARAIEDAVSQNASKRLSSRGQREL